jgi:hypothetical protein
MQTSPGLKPVGAVLKRLIPAFAVAAMMIVHTGCPTVQNTDPIRAALASSRNDALIAQKEGELATIQRQIDQAEANATVGGIDALLGAVDDADASQSGDILKGMKGKGHVALGGAQVATSQATLKGLKERKKKLEKEIRKLRKKNETFEGGHFPHTVRENISDAQRIGVRPELPRTEAPKPEQSRPHVEPHHACFVAGTPIATPDGPRPIEDIRAGDLVLSYDSANDRVVAERVLSLINGIRADLIEIDSANGSAVCSQNHPLYTGPAQWKKASELTRASALMLRAPGGRVHLKPVRVRSRDLEEPVPVFSFEVERTHNYFAGPDGLLSHNTPPGGK